MIVNWRMNGQMNDGTNHIAQVNGEFWKVFLFLQLAHLNIGSVGVGTVTRPRGHSLGSSARLSLSSPVALHSSPSPHAVLCWVAPLCLPLCNSMDYSLPGSSIHVILQARTLEWVATSFSRGSSRPRDWTHISCVSCTARRVLHHCVTWEASPSL